MRNPMTQRAELDDALLCLMRAREALKRAHAPRTAERVRLAISSAKGARRNADMRCARFELAARNAIPEAQKITEAAEAALRG